MVKQKKINSNSVALKSGIIYGIASIINAGLVFITTPFFTRVMSKNAFGDYNNFLSWYNIFSVLSLNLYASFISARRDFKENYNGYVKSIGIFNFCILTFFFTITLAVKKWMTTILGLDIIFIILMYIYIAFYQLFMMFQVNERFEYKYKMSSIMIIVCAVVTAILSMIGVCVFKNQLLGRVLGLVIPTVLAGMISLGIILLRNGKFDVSYWRYALPICIPYIPHLLSLNILNSLDKTMITKMVGSEETAIYSVAYVCGSVISLIVGVLNNAYAPWMTNKFEANEEVQVRKFSRVYVLLFEGILIGILLLTPELVYILGGEKYVEAIWIMPSIIIGCAMQLIYTMYVNVEQYYKKTGYMAVISILAAMVNFILNYICIPIYGYQIAAVTTLLSYLVLALGHIGILKVLNIKVYEDKLNILVITCNIALIPIFLIAYKYNVMRGTMIVGYLVMISMFFIRYRNKITEIIKVMIGL